MKKALCCVLAVAGLAPSADAVVTWVTQIQFRNRVGGVDGAPILGNFFALTATGVYTFTVQVGAKASCSNSLPNGSLLSVASRSEAEYEPAKVGVLSNCPRVGVVSGGVNGALS